jgi:hypothetical protein
MGEGSNAFDTATQGEGSRHLKLLGGKARHLRQLPCSQYCAYHPSKMIAIHVEFSCAESYVKGRTIRNPGRGGVKIPKYKIRAKKNAWKKIRAAVMAKKKNSCKQTAKYK